jgi:uncharacterized membrane protein (UPF0127 family)
VRKSIALVAVLSVLVAIFLFFSYAGSSHNQTMAKYSTIIFENGANLTAEIAQTPSEVGQGLMFRESLCEGCGMLFVFPREGACGFWMKNTLIPLDIIFLSSNKTVIDMKENFAPCKTAECNTYASSAPCAYAIEANAGFAKQNKISSGQQVAIRWLE